MFHSWGKRKRGGKNRGEEEGRGGKGCDPKAREGFLQNEEERVERKEMREGAGGRGVGVGGAESLVKASYALMSEGLRWRMKVEVEEGGGVDKGGLSKTP